MKTKQQHISVLAICISIVIAGAIIAYKPFEKKEDDSLFKFPSGIPPALGSFSTVALGDEQLNAIQVSGSGSVSAQANQATVTLGAWTEDPVASEAVQDNAVLMNAIIDALKATPLSILEDKIKTVTYSVYPNYDWEEKMIRNYRVTNMIQIEIDDITMIGQVIDVATEAGANSVQGITFGLSDDVVEGLMKDAYIQALQDAQGKAELIAQTLDLKITGVLSVGESSYYPYTPYRGFEEASYDAAPAPTPIIEGSLSISVTVQVAFSFE